MSSGAVASEACSSINFGRPGCATGQLSGIWLGLWVGASGGAAQSASIFIFIYCPLQGHQEGQGLRIGLLAALGECHGAEVRVLR